MANLIIKENGEVRTTPAVNGEELTIQAPCNCSDVTGVQINNVAFPFYDAAGNSIVSIRNKFAEGSLIRVMIDTVNVRAYILNSATSMAAPHTHDGADIISGLNGLAGAMGAALVTVGHYTGNGNKTLTLTFPFVPKFVYIARNSTTLKAFSHIGLIHGATYANPEGSSSYITLSWNDSGKSVTLNGSDVSTVYNQSGVETCYVGIG